MEQRERLRPVDLARLVGISAQQIRNYLDAAILPPASRSRSGYRLLTPRHRQALLTYRTLAGGYGWDTAASIMRAVHADDLAQALVLVNASHAALHEQRLSLHAARVALEAVAEQPQGGATTPRSGMPIGEVAVHLRVRPSALRVWESAGLLAPRRDRDSGYRRFGPTDIRDAQMINMLRQGRYPLSQIRQILDGLRQTGSSEALRAAFAQREAALDQRARAMLEGSSSLHHYLTDSERAGGRIA